MGGFSYCELACGDGNYQTMAEVGGATHDEQCDNTSGVGGGAGCTNCLIDSGYVCDGNFPSICEFACGNGSPDLVDGLGVTLNE
jgi:hypothetical protein